MRVGSFCHSHILTTIVATILIFILHVLVVIFVFREEGVLL